MTDIMKVLMTKFIKKLIASLIVVFISCSIFSYIKYGYFNKENIVPIIIFAIVITIVDYIGDLIDQEKI